jgi:hypothetical protein
MPAKAKHFKVAHTNTSARYSCPRQQCSHPSARNIMAGLSRFGCFDCLTEPGIVHRAVAWRLTEHLAVFEQRLDGTRPAREFQSAQNGVSQLQEHVRPVLVSETTMFSSKRSEYHGWFVPFWVL